MADLTATWSLSLDVDCPGCKQCVDLLAYPDFWDGRQTLQICEWDTPASRDMRVVCPECGHAFNVNLEY
jgi:ribosomal protein S27E